MSTIELTTAPEYLLGADENERTRLLLQGEIHRAQAQRLLGRLSVAGGGRVLDVGCGPLGVLDLLSAAVGADGEAIGLDNEPRMIAYAQRSIAELGLTNVRLALGEADETGLAGESIDLAHERQEVDVLSWACEPRHPAFDQLLATFVDAFAGLDPFVGRRLRALLRAAGLSDAEFDAQAHVWHSGHPYQGLLLHFMGVLRERIVQSAILSQARLDRLVAEVEQHLGRPDTFVIHPLFFQAWGRR
jgi:SAM-dependent methyltransferase